MEVELPGLDAEDVAGRLRDQRVCAEQLAELRDEVLERGDRGFRRLLAPQLIDDPVGRDDRTRVDEEKPEEGPLLLTSERDGSGLVCDVDRTEDPVLQHVVVVAPAASADQTPLAAPLAEHGGPV